ncbi:MAG: PrpF family protein [Candidatus Rokubacteria bacterium]|nr:PrpF family protein [Candidatus Rokubacteria bacterium]
MSQRRIRAVFMRGGTSRALFFHEADLPPAGGPRDRILLAALGSPDPYGRQLDGLGAGISSLSKACIIGPATHPHADVDYTFAQVHVREPTVDYTGNCGNSAAAVGPFAIDERLVPAVEGETLVRIHNTNTKKVIVAHVPVSAGEAAVAGDFELPGVPGRGARIRLDFLDPGGAATGRLLPTGHARDLVEGLPASLVDATNPVVFVRAADLGLRGTESPHALDADRGLAARLEALRVAAGAMMGIPGSAATPKVALVAPPAAFTALDGTPYGRERVDLVARVISMGNCHRAFALTAAMCLAVAAQTEGTVVRECAVVHPGADLKLGHPSGVLPIDAAVAVEGGEPRAERVTVYRTARRLMEGFVRVP